VIGLLVALVVAAPPPLQVCVQGRGVDPSAVHDAFTIEAKKLGRDARVEVADVCSYEADRVVALDSATLVRVGAASIDLTQVAPIDRPQEIARVALASLLEAPAVAPLIDDVLTPLPAPRSPSQAVVARPSRRSEAAAPGRVFAGFGAVTRGAEWLPELELGAWLPLGTSGLALGMRFAHLPEHTVAGTVSITRLEISTFVTLEASVVLPEHLGLAFQVGGGLAWRHTSIADEARDESDAAGLGALELRYDAPRLPLYLALAVQGVVFGGGKDYQLVNGDVIDDAPAAPRGAFGGMLRTGARF